MNSKQYLIFLLIAIPQILNSQDIEEITITKRLNKGWNDIAYNGNSATHISEALSQIWNKIEIVKNSNGFYYTSQQGYLNSLDSLNLKDGYFIKVSEDCQLHWSVLRYNYAPDKPFRRKPIDRAINIDASIYLSWQCEDSENEVLTYTILLDDNPVPSTILASNYKIDSIKTPELKYETTYYWQILVQDEFGHETKSDIFSFTTQLDNSPHGTVTDIDGNVYTWKQFGNQRWMTVNLRTTRYADGISIPNLNEYSDWDTLSTKGKAYCFYDTLGTGYTHYTKEAFGALYTWSAATNGNTDTVGVQGACPDRWHVPSDEEWTQLEHFLAENGYAYNEQDYDGSQTDIEARSKIAKSMATDWGWNHSGSVGTVGNNDYPNKQDSSGFSAVPAGYRYDSGAYATLGDVSIWWSSTHISETKAWNRRLLYNNTFSHRSDGAKEFGRPVRCVRDY